MIKLSLPHFIQEKDIRKHSEAQAHSRSNMPSVSVYSHVRKQDHHGETKPFNALRAIGLAVEAGHKACKQKVALGRLGAEHMRTIRIAGASTQVWESARQQWRAVRQCELVLSVPDVSLAVAAVKQQRAVLADLGINIDNPDKPLRGGGSADLYGEFSGPRDFGCQGKLWIEVKVMHDKGFDAKVAERKSHLEIEYRRLRAQNPLIEGVALLVTKAIKDGPGWQSPEICMELFLDDGGGWQTLAGRALGKLPRGRANPMTKPSLQECLDQVEWLPHPQTNLTVGYLQDFLRALGLSSINPGRRAASFNKMLREAGSGEVVEQVKIANKSGRPPWVASRAALRCVYRAL